MSMIVRESIEIAKAQKDGRVAIFSFNPKTGKPRYVRIKPNLILYGAADILAQALIGNSIYKIGAVYFEYKNLASPGDIIVPPVFDRSGGRSYYEGLASSSDIDILRIPIDISPNIIASDPEYEGNQITFFTATSGTEGVHGKTFNASVNSNVYGAALVATPGGNDRTQDVVFSRIYFDQIPKELNYQIGIQWAIAFS